MSWYETVEPTTQATAQVVGSAARGGAEAAREAAETGARVTSTVARGGLQLVERTAGATGAFGEVQREAARQSAEGAARVGQAFAELLAEQARHNVEAFRALSRTVDWDAAARIQGELVRVSLERYTQLTRRYLEVAQAVLASAASATREQAKKAA